MPKCLDKLTIATLGLLPLGVLAGCGSVCVSCPPQPLFASSYISDTGLLDGIVWLPRTTDRWALEGMELEIVDETPQLHVLRVPPNLEQGTYTFKSGSLEREIQIVHIDNAAPQASVHNVLDIRAVRALLDGQCNASCETTPKLELPSAREEPSPDQKYVSIFFELPEFEPEVQLSALVDVWEAGVDVTDALAPRVVDSAFLAIDGSFATVNGRTPSTSLQVRFRSAFEPDDVSEVFNVTAE